jgi:conjugative transfer region protein TrbK
MRGRFLNLPAIARAIGFALVGIAIVVGTLHFREAPSRLPDHPAGLAATTDPLSEELKRCQVLAAQAKDDADCEAAWAESLRHFFTYRQPSNTTTPSAVSTKAPDR